MNINKYHKQLNNKKTSFHFVLPVQTRMLYVPLQVWTSQLRVASHTAKYITGAPVEQWKALNELDYVSWKLIIVSLS